MARKREFSRKKISKFARLVRLKLGKDSTCNDILDPKKAVDVTFNLEDSVHPREEIELEPHDINIGASLLAAELYSDERKMSNTQRSESKPIKFGFSISTS